jgi:hypothetical protein
LLKEPTQLDERVPVEVGAIHVFYNFVEVGKNKQTPAMRLGLAKRKITVEDIVYYQQQN